MTYLLVCLYNLIFNPEDRGRIFLQNISKLLTDYTTTHPRKWYSLCLRKVYALYIPPCVVYEFENWSLTLREKHRLRVFVNRVLRRIFGLKRNEVMKDWRKLHNEELHNLYTLPNIIRMIKSRRMRWAGHVA
jgi:hypothetical protein